MVLGLRGVPDVQGGIETHARNLYPLIARLGCDVEVIQRSPYFSGRERPHRWHGVRLTYIWSPTLPGLETALHTLIGVIYAAITRPDVLHLHAIGPGFLAPLARLFGLRVVVTHHALDYTREKWGWLAKFVLRSGEYLGSKFANEVIAVSQVLADHVNREYDVAAHFIPNGVPIPLRADSSDTLEHFGLTKSRYVLCVARIEPTKRQHNLIEAFSNAATEGWKLVIVGAADEKDPYTRDVMELAARDDDVILTGFQTGRPLRELFSHAGLFVLPSSMEGHPIALLEALSFGIPVLASAIPANLAIDLPSSRFFEVGNVEKLKALLEAAVTGEDAHHDWETIRRDAREAFNWKNGARQTHAIYQRLA